MLSFPQIIEFLQYPYMRRALIVGVLIALCSSLLGVSLVLRRLSFIGDGLSHVAFGALAVAAVLQVTDNMLIIMPLTILAAVLLLKNGKKRKIMGDAGLAMLSVGALGVGYLLMSKFPTSANVSGDVCQTLFGSASIMNLSDFDLWLCIGLSVATVAAFIILYNRIFSVTFDSDFATATGTNAEAYNMIMAVITAVIIVLAMKLVGSLLISALVVFPALSAMRLFKSFKKVVICAGALSVCCTAAGIIASLVFDTPVGSTIVVAQLFVFLVFMILGSIRKG